MRVLVTGGRDYAEAKTVNSVLDHIHQTTDGITCIIHGGAKGADTLASHWALKNNIKEEVYFADWKLHGKSAGPLRNKEMLDKSNPDFAVVFPGGKGTKNMLSLVQRARIAYLDLNEPWL